LLYKLLHAIYRPIAGNDTLWFVTLGISNLLWRTRSLLQSGDRLNAWRLKLTLFFLTPYWFLERCRILIKILHRNHQFVLHSRRIPWWRFEVNYLNIWEILSRCKLTGVIAELDSSALVSSVLTSSLQSAAESSWGALVIGHSIVQSPYISETDEVSAETRSQNVVAIKCRR